MLPKATHSGVQSPVIGAAEGCLALGAPGQRWQEFIPLRQQGTRAWAFQGLLAHHSNHPQEDPSLGTQTPLGPGSAYMRVGHGEKVGLGDTPAGEERLERGRWGSISLKRRLPPCPEHRWCDGVTEDRGECGEEGAEGSTALGSDCALRDTGSAPSPLWTSVFSSTNWVNWTKGAVFTQVPSSVFEQRLLQLRLFKKDRNPQMEGFGHPEILMGLSLTNRVPREGLGGWLEDSQVLARFFREASLLLGAN